MSAKAAAPQFRDSVWRTPNGRLVRMVKELTPADARRLELAGWSRYVPEKEWRRRPHDLGHAQAPQLAGQIRQMTEAERSGYVCPKCLHPCEPDEEGVPRCRNQGGPWFMTIPDAFRH